MQGFRRESGYFLVDEEYLKIRLYKSKNRDILLLEKGVVARRMARLRVRHGG